MHIGSSMGSADPSVKGIEHYWDIDQAAAYLGLTRAELCERAESGFVPAHKLRHDGKYCWKFKPSELFEMKRDAALNHDGSVE